jgi:CHAD domain-containing protein
MKSHIDEGYRLLAAGYFRKQTKQLADQLDGVREAADIEYVHRARVASRRLRAAMKLLGGWVPRKQGKRWGKEIRRITGELGDARDKDVQIEFLCRALSDVEEPVCCPGIAHLLMHLEYEREVLQPGVVKAVDHLRASGALKEMRSAADKVLSELGKREGGVRTAGITAHATKHILRRLKRLLAHQDSLEDPEDQVRHHQMRIAAKRLRYTLEICKPLFQGELDETITAVKKVQTLLGEIHDCDVWVAHLDAFAEEERRRMAACFGSPRPFTRVKIGLDYLQQNRREARKAVFEEVVEYWRALRGGRLWEKLAETVRGEAAPAAGGGEEPTEPTLGRAGSSPATGRRTVVE